MPDVHSRLGRLAPEIKQQVVHTELGNNAGELVILGPAAAVDRNPVADSPTRGILASRNRHVEGQRRQIGRFRGTKHGSLLFGIGPGLSRLGVMAEGLINHVNQCPTLTAPPLGGTRIIPHLRRRSPGGC